MLRQIIQKITRKQVLILAVLLASVLFLRLAFFSPVKVEVIHPVKRDLIQQIYGNGTVEARVIVSLSARTTGRLVQVNVDQGDTVKRGQILARLDTAELAAQASQAAEAVEKAKATAVIELANLEKARANLFLAEKNSARYSALAAKELVSTQEAEQYQTALLLAREERNRATAALKGAEREGAATAAALAASRSRLTDSQIVAPDDGIIIRRDLEPGAIVTAGLPVFLLVNPQTVWVKANVDESRLAGLQIGQPAIISLRSAPGEKFPGRVARLGRESDRVTEELVVEVAFDRIRPDFRLGEQAEVLIATASRKEAMSIPTVALAHKEGRPGVWLITDGRLRFRFLSLGIEDRRGLVEVSSGLTGNETVAIIPPEKQTGIRDGLRVRNKK